MLAVDRDLASAEETARWPAKDGRACVAFEADVTREASMRRWSRTRRQAWGRIDVLHYNVGVSIAGGDASPTEITEEAFDRIIAINLRGW